MIKVVGFDLDGTLYEDTPEIRERVRGKIYEKIGEICGIPIGEAGTLFEKFYSKTSSGSTTIRTIAHDYGKDFDPRDIIQESLEEADILNLINPNPALAEMLKRLSNRKYLNLLTGSARKLAVEKLSRVGISPYVFTYILTAEDGSKSTGEMYQKWMAKWKGISAEEFLYVGDNKKSDVDALKSLEIKTCFVGEYANADFQIKNILDLEGLIE